MGAGRPGIAVIAGRIIVVAARLAGALEGVPAGAVRCPKYGLVYASHWALLSASGCPVAMLS